MIAIVMNNFGFMPSISDCRQHIQELIGIQGFNLCPDYLERGKIVLKKSAYPTHLQSVRNVPTHCVINITTVS